MQESGDSMKGQTSLIIDTDEEEELQASSKGQINDMIIKVKCPKPSNNIHIHEEIRPQKKLLTTYQNIQNKENIEAIREKKITYKGKPIRITAVLSVENLKVEELGAIQDPT